MLCPPIESLRDGFPDAPRVVVGAPTGTGKSTRIPLWLSQEGRVLVVEPRRVACRSLWRFVSQSTAEKVGYVVKFERAGQPEARILYVTTGVALRMAAQDQLGQFRSIILDEFHERTLEQDLLLALLVRQPPQRLVVMSATLELERVQQFLQARVLECPAQNHPVSVHYCGGPVVPSSENLRERIGGAVQQALASPGGNVLIFLPGVGEIQDCMSSLKSFSSRVELLPLHGRLTAEEQDRCFQPSTRRRLIVATNVAETSITLPGVSCVIDSGLVRQKIHRGGFSSLATEAISLASAEQRRGRAGRGGQSGSCWRLWQSVGRLEARAEPEISRLELTDIAAQAAACGVELDQLEFLDPPPTFALQAAQQRLRSWRVDPIQVGPLPLPVELARLVTQAPPEVLPDWVDLCALLQLRAPLFDGQAGAEAREQRAADFPGCRTVASLGALRAGQPARHGLRRDSWEQGREMAQHLRHQLALPSLEEPTRLQLEPLLAFLCQNWSERAFLRRPRREAWGNGEMEVQLDRDEHLPESSKAAVILQIQPLSRRALRVELRGSYALPCALSHLREAGLGQLTLGQVELRQGKVWGQLVRTYADLELGQEEGWLQGDHLRQGLTRLLLEGRFWAPEMALAQEDYRLATIQGEARVPLQEAWLLRLQRLGVEQPEDLELLSPPDLCLVQLDPATRTRLQQQFPAQFRSGLASYRVEYDPPQRSVILHWLAGTRNAPVPAHLLPRWEGWGVQLEERGRWTRVR